MESNKLNNTPESPQDVQVVDATPVEATSPQTKSGNVFIGTLNVFNAPVQKYLGEPLRRRHDRHYHARHRHGRKHLIADILLAATVVVLLGVNVYAFFFASGPRLQERVRMTITTTPETVKSGDRATITIAYVNENDAALTDARLSVLLPKQFRLLETVPETFHVGTHTFTIGTIEARGNGSVQLTGQLTGTVGETEKVSAALSYGAGESARRETKAVGFTIPITDTVLAVTIDMPATLVHEGTASFVLRYANRGQSGLSNVVLTPRLQGAFQMLESSEKLSDGAFRLPVLPAGASGEIRGRVAFRGNGDQETAFIVATAIGGVPQREERHTASVFYPRLVVTPTNDTALTLGSDTALSFTYTNDEESDVVDLALTLAPPSALLRDNSAKSFVMNTTHDPRLALVRKGTKGVAAFSLPTKSSIDRKLLFGDGDPIVRIPLTIMYRLASSPDREIRIERVTTWNVQSDIAVDAFGRYFTPEGDQLGRGSLPPRVGETTKYWIFIPVTNSISDVKDVVVTARLGANAEWTKKSSVTLGDPLSYDERTRTITWRLPLVTKFSGGAYPDVGAAIEVALTPEASQIGTEPILLDDIRLRGHDTFTNTAIEKSAAPVTTALTVDQRVKGKGKVTQ